ncbi:MAG: c-type cytochrome [bacterium]
MPSACTSSTRERSRPSRASPSLNRFRRPLLALVLALSAIALFTGGLAWLFEDPHPPASASHAQRLYYAHCVECHGTDGEGSWRAALFLVRPGDLAAPAPVTAEEDRYRFDIIKHGGAPFGRPGMPAFGRALTDEDIRLLVDYLRSLTSARSGGG